MLRHRLVYPTLALVAALSTGCALTIYRPRKADAPMPATVTANLDMAPAFTHTVISRSVYTMPKDPHLMRRILLSPNLVFESSRSSLDEPPTIGPKGAKAPAPDLKDALGEPVSISLSTELLQFLSQHGSEVIAPVVTRRWYDQWWDCPGKTCPQATWVERLLLLRHAVVTPRPEGTKGTKGPTLAPMPKLGDLPTVALAVRVLDGGTWNVPVVVTHALKGGGYVLEKKAGSSGASLCPGLSVSIPALIFQAELVSMKDGRILARIDEMRSPAASGDMQTDVVARDYDPVKKIGYTEWVDGDPNPTAQGYSYTASWTPKNVLCQNVLQAFQTKSATALKEMKQHLRKAAMQMFAKALDPLY